MIMYEIRWKNNSTNDMLRFALGNSSICHTPNFPENSSNIINAWFIAIARVCMRKVFTFDAILRGKVFAFDTLAREKSFFIWCKSKEKKCFPLMKLKGQKVFAFDPLARGKKFLHLL
jgi:hypothetical protein